MRRDVRQLISSLEKEFDAMAEFADAAKLAAVVECTKDRVSMAAALNEHYLNPQPLHDNDDLG
jgi:hypothetical protein